MSDDALPPGVDVRDVKVYHALIARCWILAGLLMELPLDALDEYTAKSETLGPMLHPTLWRKNAKGIMEDREMIRALSAARRDVLTTSPSLVDLAPIITAQADGYRSRLDQAFREIFTRREYASIPPAVILTALVRFIAARVPPPPGENV